MARITVEDCLEHVDNRFQLIHLAAKRVRQLKKGAEPTVVCKNKDIVVALREIAAGNVFRVEKGQGHDRVEARPETELVSALEEGTLMADEEDLSAAATDEDVIEEMPLESETDESEGAVKEK